MKKVFVLALAASLVTVSSFAHDCGGDKDKKKCTKDCCKKEAKAEKKEAKETAKTTKAVVKKA